MSEALLDEVAANPALTQLTEPEYFVFDENDDIFPDGAPAHHGGPDLGADALVTGGSA